MILNGRSSKWTTVFAGVPRDLVLGLLFFLIYINDVTENLAGRVKLFADVADDTSLFSVVENENDTALELNSESFIPGHGHGKLTSMLTKQKKSRFHESGICHPINPQVW